MLRRLRHKLRMIRYYSAPRHDTVWTRAADAALWITLLLALPAALIADVSYAKREPGPATSGLLIGDDENNLRAWIMDDPNATQNAPTGSTFGRWSLRISDMQRGWPLVTSVHRLPAQLDIDILSEPKERENAQLALDDPIRVAIASELERSNQDEILAAWNQDGSVSDYRWTNWLIAAAGWWILMVFASMFMIQIARIITLRVRDFRTVRRANRAAQGKCAQCGYDLTGLEFNERCPECGSLVW